jgi:hypothetical protein
VGTQSTPWRCYQIAFDARESDPRPKESCGDMVDVARRAFPSAGVPEK